MDLDEWCDDGGCGKRRTVTAEEILCGIVLFVEYAFTVLLT